MKNTCICIRIVLRWVTGVAASMLIALPEGFKASPAHAKHCITVQSAAPSRISPDRPGASSCLQPHAACL